MIPPLAALLAWPLAAIAIMQKLPAAQALIWAILASFLLLPEATALDLPGLPDLNKQSLPAFLCLMLMGMMLQNRGPEKILPGFIPASKLVTLALAVMLIGAFLTALTNTSPLFYGPTFLAPMRLYDGFSSAFGIFAMLIPMLLARKFLASPQAHILLLKALVYAALAYSLLALIEIRMSPQLNNWIYGFFPHSWAQHVRNGGYRPLVFLSHGLVLALFFAMSILAAFGLSKSLPEERKFFLGAGVWLLLVLVLSNSLGALVIACLLSPVILLQPARMQLIVCMVIGALILSYPVARGTAIIPLDRIVSMAESISTERAYSLSVRLENEQKMLEKANQRPLFGWGGWGRARIYNEKGIDVTIADGRWVILIAVQGWVRYLAEFGLFAVPFFLLFLNLGRFRIGPETTALAVILAANMIDLIPNSGLTPITWMVTGAIWGRLELAANAGTAANPAMPADPGRRGPGYRKSPPPEEDMPEAEIIPDSPASAYTRQKTRHTRPQRRKA